MDDTIHRYRIGLFLSCTHYYETIKKKKNERTALYIYWVDAKVSADFLKNVFKRCSATMDVWFSCI